ncbi:MAG: amino acid adenylation domain-containing protein [Gammaproteobacteria bacterium]|nr:amino acid adenylation domain-containing protein [Gammaproteobacteria bacterium]
MNKQNIEDIYALTPLQQGVLFHTLESTVPGVYFDQFSCQLEPTTHLDALQRAWQALILRHDVLRTLFTWEKRDKPLQIVRQRVALPWQQLDWSDVAPDQLATRLNDWLRTDRERGFELDKAPLMRITIISLPSGCVRMIWSFHHLILDGWSVRLILSELQMLYDGHVRNRTVELPPTQKFRQLVDWQRSRDTREEQAYWQDYLRDYATPVFPNIASHCHDSDAAGPRASGPEVSLMTEKQLDAATYNALQNLAKQQHVTLNTVFVAAWALVLSRYCDSQDVVFGTTVAGRTAALENIERIAGLFINTLPIRARLAPADTVAGFLQHTQKAQVTQRRYEHSSLAEVQKCSDVAGGTPLFETILVYENFPALKQATGSQNPEMLKYSEQQFIEYSNYPLAVLIVPESELKIIAVHQPARLDVPAVQQLLENYRTVLQQMADNPLQQVHALSMLTVDERQRMLTDWNLTDRPLKADETVVTLLERCASQQPGAPAISAGSHGLSYAQLNRRANRLAWQLLDADAASRGVVIYSERGADAIIAMFGALKAGAPYVNVDAKDPGGRLSLVLDDLARSWCRESAGKPVVITTEALSGDIPTDATTVILSGAPSGDARDDNPKHPLKATDVAYIIYTSGSTGRPKGVMVTHRNLYNSTDARFNFYADPVSCFALLSSLATDSAIAGIFWTLCSGGQLVIPASRAELDIGPLAKLLQDKRVSHILCVPSLYALILEHADMSCLKQLNTVIVAGESCPATLVSRHFERLPDTRLYNEYGPSEACVWASACEFSADDATQTITIGRPIQNTRLYITDRLMHPVPVGVSGELCIAGTNVASGYLGQQQLTDDSFVPDPFSPDPAAGDAGQRLYKTGDRARFLQDGRVEFLGRVDEQFKVRGYRVEPGEIESTLNACAGIGEAVVLLDDSSAIDSELNALVSRMDDQKICELLATIETMDDDDIVAALTSLHR